MITTDQESMKLLRIWKTRACFCGRKAEITPDMENKGLFLRSKSPREELAGFLMERFHCWKQLGNFRPSVEAAAWASALVPRNVFFSSTLKMALNGWHRALTAR